MRDEDDADVEVALHRLDQLDDLRLHRDVERRRRLVGDQHVGVVHERHRDHGALAHAARELVRVVARPLLRVRDADAVEQLDRDPARVLPGGVLVREHGLGDLVADAVHRVQRRERVLEDHRDVAPADLAQLVGGQREQLGALEDDLAADLGALAVEQAHDREVGDALPRARLADDAERLAAAKGERDVGDRLHHAVRGREANRQAADVEQPARVTRRRHA